jgi:hypothetical protein
MDICMPENKCYFNLLTEQRPSQPKKFKNYIFNWYCVQSAGYKLSYFQNAKHNYLLRKLQVQQTWLTSSWKETGGVYKTFFHFSVSL